MFVIANPNWLVSKWVSIKLPAKGHSVEFLVCQDGLLMKLAIVAGEFELVKLSTAGVLALGNVLVLSSCCLRSSTCSKSLLTRNVAKISCLIVFFCIMVICL